MHDLVLPPKSQQHHGRSQLLRKFARKAVWRELDLYAAPGTEGVPRQIAPGPHDIAEATGIVGPQSAKGDVVDQGVAGELAEVREQQQLLWRCLAVGPQGVLELGEGFLVPDIAGRPVAVDMRQHNAATAAEQVNRIADFAVLGMSGVDGQTHGSRRKACYTCGP